jgi:hypothetical protein
MFKVVNYAQGGMACSRWCGILKVVEYALIGKL